MIEPHDPYIPKGRSETIDKLCSMMLLSPTFKDKSGYFPDKNIDTEFFALNEALRLMRRRLGETTYVRLVGMSAQMRAHFEADPESVNGGTKKGCQLIDEMIDILRGKSLGGASALPEKLDYASGKRLHSIALPTGSRHHDTTSQTQWEQHLYHQEAQSMSSYTPYIPQHIYEITDLLAVFMIDAPLFVDKSGYFSGKTIDTEFFRLREGIKAIRVEIGEDRFATANGLIDRMRTHFEADPQDKTDDSVKGRELILVLQTLLLEAYAGNDPAQD